MQVLQDPWTTGIQSQNKATFADSALRVNAVIAGTLAPICMILLPSKIFLVFAARNANGVTASGPHPS